MASTRDDWRSAISATDRFENIQRIKSSLQAAGPEAAATSQSEAFLLETQAYQSCATREQYDQVCRVVGQAAQVLVDPPLDQESSVPETGITIGSYEGCQPIASGVTSEVFRCKDRALKVIVETHNIEPHNPRREAKILDTLKRPCIPLLESFRDQEQRFVLVFPFMPLTLEGLLKEGPLTPVQLRTIFRNVFGALRDIHKEGIIHRDIKPAAILLESPDGPAYLSDFGTAWHPEMSSGTEPSGNKILDIGTGSYRAPECLFGDKSYDSKVDMWAAGAMLAESCRDPPRPLFHSPPTHEDGSQLGLILSIFKTLGTPTPTTWPEAAEFKTTPFSMYREMPGQTWEEILPDIDPLLRDLIASLVRYDAKRATAESALGNKALALDE